MSTFAVFGMTLSAALTEARKKTPSTEKAQGGGVVQLSEAQWMQRVEQAADRMMQSAQVRQLSPLFDAPQFAEKFIELARKAGRCRDMRIRAKAELKDAQGKTIIDPKTKAPKYGFQDWVPTKESAA